MFRTGNDRKLLMGLGALAIAMGLNLSGAQAQDADRFPASPLTMPGLTPAPATATSKTNT